MLILVRMQEGLVEGRLLCPVMQSAETFACIAIFRSSEEAQTCKR